MYTPDDDTLCKSFLKNTLHSKSTRNESIEKRFLLRVAHAYIDAGHVFVFVFWFCFRFFLGGGYVAFGRPLTQFDTCPESQN